MGTNFYLRIGEKDLHIGKLSVGWTFSFRAHNTHNIIRSFNDWKKMFIKGLIYDEYGNKWDSNEFIDLVISEKDAPNNYSKKHPSKRDFLDKEGNSFSDCDFT